MPTHFPSFSPLNCGAGRSRSAYSPCTCLAVASIKPVKVQCQARNVNCAPVSYRPGISNANVNCKANAISNYLGTYVRVDCTVYGYDCTVAAWFLAPILGNMSEAGHCSCSSNAGQVIASATLQASLAVDGTGCAPLVATIASG